MKKQKDYKLGTIKNLTYDSPECSECGNTLTEKDMFRKNRILARPFVNDCESCEKIALAKII